MHFHKFAVAAAKSAGWYGSGKWWSFPLFLNVWALLHNLSDHRYISCGKIWHHIHHGSNYAETKKNKKRRSLSSMYLDNEKNKNNNALAQEKICKVFFKPPV